MTTRIVLLVSVAAALLGAAHLSTRTAEAHAALVRSAPASQARLPTPPVVVDLWFSEPLEPRFSGFTVYGGSGQAVAVRDIAVDAQDQRHLTGRLPQLRPGIYTVPGYRQGAPTAS